MTAKRKPKRNTKADAFADIMAADPEFAAAQSPHDLQRSGGVQHWEEQAAAQAIRQTRERWLDTLEGWQADLVASGEDADVVADTFPNVAREIERLHRKLGIKQSIETRRAKTLERVRRFRERQTAARGKAYDRVHAFVVVALKTFVQEQRNDLSAEAIAAFMKRRDCPLDLVAKVLADLRASGVYDRIVADATTA